MTKVIAILRHAQSAGKQTGQRDYDRTLTTQGEAKVRFLGQKLKKQNFNPELILSSGSARTRQTVALLNESLQIEGSKIQFKTELYDALMANWHDFIHELPDTANTVLLVGHNPWLSMLASDFAGEFCDLSPCELISFEFQVDLWKEITGSGKKVLNIKIGIK